MIIAKAQLDSLRYVTNVLRNTSQIAKQKNLESLVKEYVSMLDSLRGRLTTIDPVFWHITQDDLRCVDFAYQSMLGICKNITTDEKKALAHIHLHRIRTLIITLTKYTTAPLFPKPIE